jgi:hypothetical protein
VIVLTSVGDPDPYLQDQHVFGPPGSESISQRYGSGSASKCHGSPTLALNFVGAVFRDACPYFLGYKWIRMRSSAYKKFLDPASGTHNFVVSTKQFEKVFDIPGMCLF